VINGLVVGRPRKKLDGIQRRVFKGFSKVQIADKSSRITSFETGFCKTTDEIIDYITTNQNRVTGLSQNLYLFKQETNLQQARIRHKA
jgi:hypothetical protein